MGQRKVRILMARLGEGYEAAMMRLTRAFSEAGFEVIYLDLQDPEAIVAAALQESVDHIGITTLPQADIQRFAQIRDLLRQENADKIHVTAGGFLNEEDIPRLKEMGVVEFFPRETSYEDLIRWAKENIHPVDN